MEQYNVSSKRQQQQQQQKQFVSLNSNKKKIIQQTKSLKNNNACLEHDTHTKMNSRLELNKIGVYRRQTLIKCVDLILPVDLSSDQVFNYSI